MGTLYNFARLINKYKSNFVSVSLADGYYDESGDWKEAETERTNIQGAIISFKESKVYRSDGTLTANDKRLFMLQPLDDKLQGLKAIYDGKIYSIEDCTENAKFTGVYAYTLKYISAFKDKSPDYDLTEEVDALEKRLDGKLVDKPVPPPTESEILTESIGKLEKRLDGVLNDD